MKLQMRAANRGILARLIDAGMSCDVIPVRAVNSSNPAPARQSVTIPPMSSTSSPSTDVWTTRRLLVWMTSYFHERNIEFPRLCAELLLAGVIGCDRLRLYMEADRPASPEELARLRTNVVRAGQHEPIAYILGCAWFFGMEFRITPDTLVPRPATATLVEQVIQDARSLNLSSGVIVDVATGSGVIAIALAACLKGFTVFATDISDAALAVASANAESHRVADRVKFLRGDLLGALQEWQPSLESGVDYLVCNPPYISDIEWEQVEQNVKGFEPHIALRGGADGLDYIRRLISGAARWLKPGGLLAVEIAASQGDAVLALTGRQDSCLADAKVIPDHEGYPRVLIARRRCEQ